MRRGSGEGVEGPGEIQMGALFLEATPRPVLTPRQAQLYYYVELYPAAEALVGLSARVVDAAGEVIMSTAPEELELSAAGGVAARGIGLAGLPEGSYSLELTARFLDGEVVRSAPFSMTGFGTDTRIARLARSAGAAEDEFAELTEDRLDSLYQPLMYIMEADERGVYPDLSLDAKRSFMRQFWQKRDPSPGTPANEYQESYYRLFAEATRRFRESGAGDTPGWRTDRGRVFLKRGEPEDVLRRPNPQFTRPYEVWKYTRPRLLKYVFYDQTGLGNYTLIFTDDRFETSRGDWMSLLGRDAVEEVLLF